MRIVFDDGHDSGLFTWVYLAELGANKEAKWQAYLDELKQKVWDGVLPCIKRNGLWLPRICHAAKIG